MPPLPTDIDASYPDDLSDPSVSLHQQYHDQIHVAVNAIEAAYDAAVTAGFAGTMEEWLEQLNAAATTYQTVAEKGAADGYASLDSGGKVPAAQLPDLSLGLSTVAATGSYNDLTDTPAYSTALRLTAPDSTVYEVTVDNAGTLTTTVVP